MTDRASRRSTSPRREREPRRDITAELIGLAAALVQLAAALVDWLAG